MTTPFRIALFAIALTLMVHVAPVNAREQLSWSPSLETGNTVFPAFILATRNFHPPQSKLDEKRLGDTNGLFGIKIKSPADDTKIRVTVSIDGLSDASMFTGEMPEAGKEYEVMPYIRYKADALWRIKQPYPTTAIFTVSINDAPAQEITRNLNVRSVNDVPFVIKQDGKEHDTAWLFSAFVNENHPIIDTITKDALHHKAVNEFVGYSNGEQETIRQIFAVWNFLQRNDTKYSNIVTPSGYTKDIYSQSVRMIDETARSSQANCVDGTVFLASVLEKVGMCTMLVMKPGHMFLGIYHDQQACDRKDMHNAFFIETTAVGVIKPFNPFMSNRLNAAQKNWQFKTNDGYRASVSYQSLIAAIEQGGKEFAEVQGSIAAKQAGYRILDIRKLREMGITPISSSEQY